MEISISGQEISGQCPRCGELPKFLLTWTIAADLTKWKFEIVSLSVACKSCRYSRKFLPQEKAFMFAQESEVVLENLLLSLYKQFAVATLAERHKISEGQS
jgi:hypothetical protein